LGKTKKKLRLLIEEKEGSAVQNNIGRGLTIPSEDGPRGGAQVFPVHAHHLPAVRGGQGGKRQTKDKRRLRKKNANFQNAESCKKSPSAGNFHGENPTWSLNRTGKRVRKSLTSASTLMLFVLRDKDVGEIGPQQ